MATAPKPRRGKAAKATEPAEQGAVGALPQEQQGAGSGSPLAVSDGAQGLQKDQQTDAASPAAAVQEGVTPAAEQESAADGQQGAEGDQAGQQESAAGGDAEATAMEPSGDWEMPEVTAFPAALQFRNATGEPVLYAGFERPLAPGGVVVVGLGERAYRRLKKLLPALAKVRGWNNEFGVMVNEHRED